MLDAGAYTPYYDYSLCKALVEAGCQVQWMTAPFIYDQIPNRDGLDIWYGFSRLLNVPWPCQLQLRRFVVLRRVVKAIEYPFDWVLLFLALQRNPPDILHMQWVVNPTLDVVVLGNLRRLGCRVVYTAHNVLPHDARPGDRVRYARLYRLADAIITLSNHSRQQLQRLFQVPEEKVHLVPMGNLDDFRGPPITREEARAQLGLPDGSPIALFFGLLRPYKGLASLIQAFATVRTQLPEALLLIVGQPHGSFAPYHQLMHKLGLSDAVRTVLRYVSHCEMAAWFTAADVVVLPYLATSQSAVLMTAYTFGRPVVSTTVGGLPEAVEPGQSGLLVPPSDEAALAEAIVALLADSHRCTQMGHYARRLAETRYSWQTVASATLDVYQSLMNVR